MANSDSNLPDGHNLRHTNMNTLEIGHTSVNAYFRKVNNIIYTTIETNPGNKSFTIPTRLNNLDQLIKLIEILIKELRNWNPSENRLTWENIIGYSRDNDLLPSKEKKSRIKTFSDEGNSVLTDNNAYVCNKNIRARKISDKVDKNESYLKKCTAKISDIKNETGAVSSKEYSTHANSKEFLYKNLHSQLKPKPIITWEDVIHFAKYPRNTNTFVLPKQENSAINYDTIYRNPNFSNKHFRAPIAGSKQIATHKITRSEGSFEEDFDTNNQAKIALNNEEYLKTNQVRPFYENNYFRPKHNNNLKGESEFDGKITSNNTSQENLQVVVLRKPHVIREINGTGNFPKELATRGKKEIAASYLFKRKNESWNSNDVETSDGKIKTYIHHQPKKLKEDEDQKQLVREDVINFFKYHNKIKSFSSPKSKIVMSKSPSIPITEAVNNERTTHKTRKNEDYFARENVEVFNTKNEIKTAVNNNKISLQTAAQRDPYFQIRQVPIFDGENKMYPHQKQKQVDESVIHKNIACTGIPQGELPVTVFKRTKIETEGKGSVQDLNEFASRHKRQITENKCLQPYQYKERGESSNSKIYPNSNSNFVAYKPCPSYEFNCELRNTSQSTYCKDELNKNDATKIPNSFYEEQISSFYEGNDKVIIKDNLETNENFLKQLRDDIQNLYGKYGNNDIMERQKKFTKEQINNLSHYATLPKGKYKHFSFEGIARNKSTVSSFKNFQEKDDDGKESYSSKKHNTYEEIIKKDMITQQKGKFKELNFSVKTQVHPTEVSTFLNQDQKRKSGVDFQTFEDNCELSKLNESLHDSVTEEDPNGSNDTQRLSSNSSEGTKINPQNVYDSLRETLEKSRLGELSRVKYREMPSQGNANEEAIYAIINSENNTLDRNGEYVVLKNPPNILTERPIQHESNSFDCKEPVRYIKSISDSSGITSDCSSEARTSFDERANLKSTNNLQQKRNESCSCSNQINEISRVSSLNFTEDNKSYGEYVTLKKASFNSRLYMPQEHYSRENNVEFVQVRNKSTKSRQTSSLPSNFELNIETCNIELMKIFIQNLKIPKPVTKREQDEKLPAFRSSVLIEINEDNNSKTSEDFVVTSKSMKLFEESKVKTPPYARVNKIKKEQTEKINLNRKESLQLCEDTLPVNRITSFIESAKLPVTDYSSDSLSRNSSFSELKPKVQRKQFKYLFATSSKYDDEFDFYSECEKMVNKTSLKKARTSFIKEEDGVTIRTRTYGDSKNEFWRETYCDSFGFPRIDKFGRISNSGPVTPDNTAESASTSNVIKHKLEISDSSSASSPNPNKKSRLALMIEELINTEETYIIILDVIIHDYYYYLEELDVPLLGERYQQIFGNIKDIYFQQRDFYDTLLKCNNVEDIADTFIKFETTLFSLYPIYLRNKNTSDYYINEWYRDIIEKRELELKDELSLASHLLAPLQRIGKYILLLNGMRKELLKIGRTSAKLESAIALVKSHMNRGNDLIAIESIQNIPFKPESTGSFLLRDTFTILKPKRSTVTLFLFEEVLLFTTTDLKYNPMFAYKDKIFIKDMGIVNFEDYPLVFHLKEFRHVNKNRLFVLEAPSKEVKDTWVKTLEDYVWKQLTVNSNDEK